jgi:hypothetical protein
MVNPQQADHCTRCRKLFKASAVRFMVQEHVVCEVLKGMVVARGETVPVCKACVTIEEQTRSTRKAVCECRGVPMLMSEHRRNRFFAGNIHIACSKRCAQRERRKRRSKYRYRPQRTCPTCNVRFQPTRADAEYCSNACRQRAYRLRSIG